MAQLSMMEIDDHQKMEIHSVGPFVLGKTLGTGTTGKVKLGFHKETGAKVAIKIISKEFIASRITVLKKIEREIAVMKLLDHPHVLKLYDVYETSKYLFLVLEFVESGELFDYLVKKGRLEASEALSIFQQIISGLEYCHNHMVCHRDLKPENLLLDGEKSIKIADFGMASLMKKGHLLQTSCGSPHYASPEVVMGKLPFDDDNIRRLLSKVKSGVYTMPQFLHKDVKDLITRMLVVDPSKRITIAQIKEHPWFKSNVLEVPKNVLESFPVEPSTLQLSDASQIDDELVRTLHSLGWGTEDEIRKTLLDPQPNLEQTFYQLLRVRKLKSAEPKNSAALRNRVNSAPAPPQLTIQAVSTLPPVSGSSVHSTNINNNNTATLPSAPIPAQSSPIEINSKRRTSSTTSPISIIGASQRFQRMKLETPSSSPIIGSSPKKSWFSVFFSKSEKESEKEPVYPRNNLNLSFPCNRQLSEIVDDLQQILKAQNISFESLNSQTLAAEAESNSMVNPGTIKFNIEILSAGKDNNYLVSFEHVSGDPNEYASICENIQESFAQ